MTYEAIKANNKRIVQTGMACGAFGASTAISVILTHGFEVLPKDLLFFAQCLGLGCCYAFGLSLLVLSIRGEVLNKKLIREGQPKQKPAAAKVDAEDDDVVEAVVQ